MSWFWKFVDVDFLCGCTEVSVGAAKSQVAAKRQADPKAVYGGVKKTKSEDSMIM